jgi:G:T-mismatch repair DNA endonuclease (very short patch repair protein)
MLTDEQYAQFVNKVALIILRRSTYMTDSVLYNLLQEKDRKITGKSCRYYTAVLLQPTFWHGLEDSCEMNEAPPSRTTYW